uniref:Integral membrane protein n=1 Tax=Streptomyces sp. NBC_00049 TaxID=2903617 RepID=A0AAU2JT91_9ACTN
MAHMLLILFLFLAGLLSAVGLIGYGLATVGREWRRGLTALLGAVAAACYAWGVLHVAGAVLGAEDGGTDSTPLRPCRTPGQEERASQVVDYSVDYVPLRFVCETADGGSYAAERVPGYVNPAVAVLALGAAGAGAAARKRSRERGAAQEPAG